MNRSALAASVHLIISLAATILAAAACNPIYYSPATQNVSLLAERGDLAGALAVGESRFEGQGAFAITSSIGVQLNAGKYDPDDLDNGDGGSGSYVEAGVGWFGRRSDRFRWEVYGVVGTGDFENHRPSSVASNPGTTGNIEGKVLRVGIQPAAGFIWPYFEVAGSARLASIKYSDVEGSFRFQGADQIARLRSNDSYTLIEPALTLRGGLPRVKLQFQLARSVNVTESEFEQDDGLLTIAIVGRR
jgi:hypothetical protein